MSTLPVPASPTPGPSAPAAAVKPAATAGAEANAFAAHDFSHAVTGKWRAVRPSPFYALALTLVAFMVALLPLVYFAMIGVIGYGVYWHLMHNAPDFSSTHPRTALFLVFVYIAPAAVGAFMALFMLKPVIARAAEEDEPFSLFASEEPRLFRFIGHVCATMGAPTPSRIDVICDVNASAGFGSGWLGLLGRNNLVLRIGMPLAAGLSVNQFAGVIAHELGHFSQGWAMRATWIIGRIEFWFARVAYSRDIWDVRLKELQDSIGQAEHQLAAAWLVHGLLSLTVGLARFGIWLTRFILMCLFFVSRALTSHLGRQMEFNADRYEARFTGSATFAESCKRMDELSAAYPIARDEAQDFYSSSQPRKLPDDLPALIADHATRLTHEDLQRLELERAAQKGGLFTTHPPTPQRIAAAASADEPGVFNLPGPASSLFSDFSGACRKATYAYYKAHLGGFLYDATLVPTKQLLAPRQKEAERRKAITAYIGFEPPTWRPLLPGIVALPESVDPKLLVARIKQGREKLRACAPGAIKAVPVYRDATEKQQRAEVVVGLLDAGLPVEYKRFGVPAVGRVGVSQFGQRCKDEMIPAADAIDDALEAGQQRLGAALGLLRVPGIESRIRDVAKHRARAQQLLTMLGAMRGMLPQAREMRQDMALAEALIRAVEKDKHLDKMKEKVRPLADRIRDRLGSLREAGGGTPYPYEDSQGSGNLGQRLVGATPAWRDFGEIFGAGDRFVQRFAEDLWRGSAEIVDLARGVEKAAVSKPGAEGEKKAEGADGLPAWW